MANEIIMTKEGYDDLVRELNELKTTRRAEISEKIRVARGFGDLSENSEYDEAKNEQAIVEARILTLENQLKNVKIVEKSAAEKGTVSIGSFVTIRDVEFGDELTYRIISSVETQMRNVKFAEYEPKAEQHQLKTPPASVVEMDPAKYTG